MKGIRTGKVCRCGTDGGPWGEGNDALGRLTAQNDRAGSTVRYADGKPSLVALAGQLLLFFVASLVPATLAQASDEVRHRFITVGTGSPTGVYFAAGEAICEAVNRQAERQAAAGEKLVTACRVSPSGGSAFNLRQVATGAFTFVIAQANDQRAAVDGSDPERVKTVPGLRSVLSLHPEVVHVVLPRQSDIKSVSDLANRRISPGNHGSGTRVIAGQLVSAHGLGKDDFEAIDALTMEEQAEALCSGKVDAFITVTAVPGTNVMEAAKACGVELLPLQGGKIEAMVSRSADLVDAQVPANSYPDQEAPVDVIGVRAGLVTRDIVPDDIVRDVISAVLKELPQLQAAHPSLAGLDPQQMAIEGHGAPLHDGASSYFEERGLR